MTEGVEGANLEVFERLDRALAEPFEWEDPLTVRRELRAAGQAVPDPSRNTTGLMAAMRMPAKT
jgi:hypothetical protein